MLSGGQARTPAATPILICGTTAPKIGQPSNQQPRDMVEAKIADGTFFHYRCFVNTAFQSTSVLTAEPIKTPGQMEEIERGNG